MPSPAHKVLIDEHLNWDLVKNRLSRYKNINKFFPFNDLKKCSSKAPYYCHYLALRLGTWNDELWFKFFDSLLASASILTNWSNNRIPQGCEFENFWSFLWELQVAQLFVGCPNTKVEWIDSGPDLKVVCDSSQFFVECTIYRKSFGLEEFIGDVLRLIHTSIRVEHAPLIKYSLPKNQNVDSFLDELFGQFTDESYLQAKLREAQNISPIMLFVPKSVSNFYVFIENHDAKDFNPLQPWTNVGNSEDFLNVVAKEILVNKRASNNLISFRPNLLAVNLLLGQDFQLALATRGSVPDLKLDPVYDCVMLMACGIDSIPSLKDAKNIQFYENHPINSLLNL